MQERITSSPTGSSMLTVSKALLGVAGTAVGDCGVMALTCDVTASICGVTASTCGVTASTSPLNLEKVSTSIVGRSRKVEDKLSDEDGRYCLGL